MTCETKELRGALFANFAKRTEREPNYTGDLKVGGKLLRIDGWKRRAK